MSLNLYDLVKLQTLLKPVLEFVAWCDKRERPIPDYHQVAVGTFLLNPDDAVLTMGDLRKVAALLKSQQPEVKSANIPV